MRTLEEVLVSIVGMGGVTVNLYSELVKCSEVISNPNIDLSNMYLTSIEIETFSPRPVDHINLPVGVYSHKIVPEEGVLGRVRLTVFNLERRVESKYEFPFLGE